MVQAARAIFQQSTEKPPANGRRCSTCHDLLDIYVPVSEACARLFYERLELPSEQKIVADVFQSEIRELGKEREEAWENFLGHLKQAHPAASPGSVILEYYKRRSN